MSATLTPRATARPKRSGVRHLPNPSHRPTDLKILGFEAAFDALVAESDDAKAMSDGLLEIQRAGSLQAMTISRMRAMRTLTDADNRVLWACNKHLADVVAHLRERADRLRNCAIPEERRIAGIFDCELAMRECGS
jgi:hypothetical protein